MNVGTRSQIASKLITPSGITLEQNTGGTVLKASTPVGTTEIENGSTDIQLLSSSVSFNTIIDASGGISTGILQNTAAQTTVLGTTAGSFIASMPEQGSSYKKVLIWLNGYENDTVTAQIYTFPVAFSETPAITTNTANVPGVTVTTTEVELAPNTTTVYTGWIIIEGY